MTALSEAVACLDRAIREAAARYHETGEPHGFSPELMAALSVVEILKKSSPAPPPSIEVLREELHRLKEKRP